MAKKEKAEKASPKGREPSKTRVNAVALGDALRSLSFETPDLPEVIDAAAFASGGFPYEEKMKRKLYERELLALQIELLKAQDWVVKQGERVLILFEGRDGAGKGGTIHRITQHLSPRGARVVALPKPSDAERGQWYFQRYVQHMPTAGEIVLFDRSWYNRAVVEPVMGFCTPDQTSRFLQEAPAFERILVRDGIRLFKIFLTIGEAMQAKRLHARYHDPLKRWKLSPLDFEALKRWSSYSDAIDTMLERTDTLEAPWTIIKANDKMRTRLSAIRTLLTQLPYPDKDEALVNATDPKIILSADAFLAHGGEV
ncbi:MAG: polyphosphate kinase 2 [bacterium]|jgi:polyphosphate kinase 2